MQTEYLFASFFSRRQVDSFLFYFTLKIHCKNGFCSYQNNCVMGIINILLYRSLWIIFKQTALKPNIFRIIWIILHTLSQLYRITATTITLLPFNRSIHNQRQLSEYLEVLASRSPHFFCFCSHCLVTYEEKTLTYSHA